MAAAIVIAAMVTVSVARPMMHILRNCAPIISGQMLQTRNPCRSAMPGGPGRRLSESFTGILPMVMTHGDDHCAIVIIIIGPGERLSRT
jgi:hypothetical protein